MPSFETYISREYHFESAHFLPHVSDNHKCKRVHGHNYRVEVAVAHAPGRDLDEAMWVIDFWDMDAIVQPLIDSIDHRLLNNIEGFENPTAENIARVLYERLADKFSAHDCLLAAITVWEVAGSCAVYRRVR